MATPHTDEDCVATTTTSLRPLCKATILSPQNQSQRSRVHGALSRIGSVRIRDCVHEDGHRFYVVDVKFTSSQSAGVVKFEPPTGNQKTSSPVQFDRLAASNTSGPVDDLQIKHRFGDFSNLRHEIYYHARAGHRHDAHGACGFCTSAVALLEQQTPRLPSLVSHLLFSGNVETNCQQLEEFVNLALQLARAATKTHTSGGGGGSRRWCEGREMVPLLVKKFLLGDGVGVAASGSDS